MYLLNGTFICIIVHKNISIFIDWFLCAIYDWFYDPIILIINSESDRLLRQYIISGNALWFYDYQKLCFLKLVSKLLIFTTLY